MNIKPTSSPTNLLSYTISTSSDFTELTEVVKRTPNIDKQSLANLLSFLSIAKQIHNTSTNFKITQENLTGALLSIGFNKDDCNLCAQCILNLKPAGETISNKTSNYVCSIIYPSTDVTHFICKHLDNVKTIEPIEIQQILLNNCTFENIFDNHTALFKHNISAWFFCHFNQQLPHNDKANLQTLCPSDTTKYLKNRLIQNKIIKLIEYYCIYSKDNKLSVDVLSTVLNTLNEFKDVLSDEFIQNSIKDILDSLFQSDYMDNHFETYKLLSSFKHTLNLTDYILMKIYFGNLVTYNNIDKLLEVNFSQLQTKFEKMYLNLSNYYDQYDDRIFNNMQSTFLDLENTLDPRIYIDQSTTQFESYVTGDLNTTLFSDNNLMINPKNTTYIHSMPVVSTARNTNEYSRKLYTLVMFYDKEFMQPIEAVKFKKVTQLQLVLLEFIITYCKFNSFFTNRPDHIIYVGVMFNDNGTLKNAVLRHVSQTKAYIMHNVSDPTIKKHILRTPFLIADSWNDLTNYLKLKQYKIPQETFNLFNNIAFAKTLDDIGVPSDIIKQNQLVETFEHELSSILDLLVEESYKTRVFQYAIAILTKFCAANFIGGNGIPTIFENIKIALVYSNKLNIQQQIEEFIKVDANCLDGYTQTWCKQENSDDRLVVSFEGCHNVAAETLLRYLNG